MCHQSVGLVQGQIERAGIPTVSTSVVPYVTRNMRVPRAVYLRFPIGNPIGEPDKPEHQRTVLGAVLAAFEAIEEPGATVELPFRWRRPIEPHVIGDDVEDLAEGYRIAREYAVRIGQRYEELLATCEEYRARLQEALDALDPDTTQPKEVVLVRRQVQRIDDLIDLLEKPVNDQVLLNSSRYFLIQLAHEGKFR